MEAGNNDPGSPDGASAFSRGIGERLRAVEPHQAIAIAALLLLVCMFLPWYGTKEVVTPTGFTLPARDVTINAWRSFDLIDIVLALSIITILGSAWAARRSVDADQRAALSLGASAAAALACALVLYRLAVPLSSVEREIGLLLAVPAALAMLGAGIWWMIAEGTDVGATAKRLTRAVPTARPSADDTQAPPAVDPTPPGSDDS